MMRKKMMKKVGCIKDDLIAKKICGDFDDYKFGDNRLKCQDSLNQSDFKIYNIKKANLFGFGCLEIVNDINKTERRQEP